PLLHRIDVLGGLRVLKLLIGVVQIVGSSLHQHTQRQRSDSKDGGFHGGVSLVELYNAIIRSGDVSRTFSPRSAGRRAALLRCEPSGPTRYSLHVSAARNPASPGSAGLPG